MRVEDGNVGRDEQDVADEEPGSYVGLQPEGCEIATQEEHGADDQEEQSGECSDCEVSAGDCSFAEEPDNPSKCDDGSETG